MHNAQNKPRTDLAPLDCQLRFHGDQNGPVMLRKIHIYFKLCMLSPSDSKVGSKFSVEVNIAFCTDLRDMILRMLGACRLAVPTNIVYITAKPWRMSSTVPRRMRIVLYLIFFKH